MSDNRKRAEVIKLHKVAKKVIKPRLCYVAKEGEKRKRLHDNLYVDLTYVTRAEKPETYIAAKAQILLANLARMISKNSEGEEFVDHDFLSAITHCRSSKQNRSILGQLADIIDYKYYNCVIFQGKRRVFGYTVKFTTDGKSRIENPGLFYDFALKKLEKDTPSGGKKNPCRVGREFPNRMVKNSLPKREKILAEEEKISTPIYIDNTIDNIKEIDLYRSRSNESSFVEKELEQEVRVGESSTIDASFKREQNISVTLSPSNSLVSAATNCNRKRKSLSEFYPVSEEDAENLRRASGREFNANYINQLIVKLSKENPDYGFFTKELFMRYMTKLLSNELRQAEQVNKEEFRFRQDEESAAREAYLNKVEESTDTSKVSQLKRKIAASLDTEIAYRLLSGCFFAENTIKESSGQQTYQITQYKGQGIELLPYQRETAA